MTERAILPRVAILGGGRAGTALAREFVASDVELLGVWNRSPRPRPDGLDGVRWNTGTPSPPPALLAAADVVFLAVLDSAIEEAATGLRVSAGTIVMHLSGSRGTEALAGLPDGVIAGCYHPLQSFTPGAVPALPVPPYCLAIEGAPEALDAARALAQATGHPAVTLDAGGKAAYHAAAVLASNCLVALEAAATRVMGLAGPEGPDRWQLLWPLVVGTLANLSDGDFSGAITGPVPRGDAATVERNLAAIADDEGAAALYRALGRAALELVRDRLDPERAEAVEKSLRG